MNEKPNATEIALIAATLSRGNSVDACRLAREAVQLWCASCDAIEEHNKTNREIREAAEKSTVSIYHDPADDAPVSWKDGIRAIFPGQSEADYLPTFRRFLVYVGELNDAKNADPDYPKEFERVKMTMEQRLDYRRRNGWKNGEAFKWYHDLFEKWHKDDISRKRSASGRKGGEKSAGKLPVKNPLRAKKRR
jgi:hypothetical protein